MTEQPQSTRGIPWVHAGVIVTLGCAAHLFNEAPLFWVLFVPYLLSNILPWEARKWLAVLLVTFILVALLIPSG